MSKRHKAKRNANPPVAAATGRRPFRLAVVGLAVIVVAAGSFWWFKGRQSGTQPAVASSTETPGTNPSAVATRTSQGFEKLKGKWVRPDGGYIVEIRNVEPDGKMDAAYFNPRPINVAKAVALQDGQTVKVFIELRDVNYPGSTYTLAYEAASDQLTGIYYQAAMQQKFEVYFERVK